MVNDEIEAKEIIGNFEIGLGEDVILYVNKFLDLKEEILLKNPNAKIMILGREILIDDNGKRTIYVMENGEISPAKMKTPSPVKTNFAPSKEERSANLPKLIKQSIFYKILLGIKRKLFRNSGEDIIYYNENKGNEGDFKEKQCEFKGRISDMSNYKEIQKEVNVEDIESELEQGVEENRGDR